MNIKILCYHGVVANPFTNGVINYNFKHISIKDFERQMNYLKKNEHVIALKNIQNINQDDKKKYSVITFDDGFQNNFNIAYNILRKYKLPATFFLCPGMIEKKNLFWVDQIEIFFHNTKEKTLNIFLDKNKYFDISNLKKKIITCEKIKKFCKKVANKKKDQIIKDLKKKLKISKFEKQTQFHDILTWAQINEMNKSNLIDFGIHSFKHEIYSNLTKKDLKKNIAKCKKILLKKLNISTVMASYPEGKLSDFNLFTIKTMKDNGIIICPTAIPGINYSNLKKFYLKRYMVGFNKLKFPYSAYHKKD